MTASADPLLAPGTRLAHYEVRTPLRAGAMGTVYEAYDTSLFVLGRRTLSDVLTRTRAVYRLPASAAASVTAPR